MPKIAIYKYLVFFLYAGDMSERMHLHIYPNRGNRKYSAKIFIENGIEIADAGILNDQELNLAVKLIEKNLSKIENQVSRFMNGEKVTTINLKLK